MPLVVKNIFELGNESWSELEQGRQFASRGDIAPMVSLDY